MSARCRNADAANLVDLQAMSFDRSRSRWARALSIALAATFVSSWSSRAAADPAPATPSLLSTSEVRWLEQRGWLERDPARVLRALGPYSDRVTGAEHVRLDDVRVAHIEALECVLGRVAAQHLGVAQFFTDPLFRAGGASSVVVLLDPATLSVLDQIFDLHTIFPPSVVPAPPAAPVHMRFLLAGQGRLLMAYDGATSYAHRDDAYSIFGNRDYQVHPFARMTIGAQHGDPALLDLAVADGPRAPLQPFKKHVLFLWPEIHGLFVHGRDVTADTSVIDRKIRPPPIEWRSGAASGARRLAQNGCPADSPWGGVTASSPAR
jgi:hypothetical protein